MGRDEIKQVVINTLETYIELQVRALRQMKGEDVEELISLPRKGKRRQSIVDLSLDLLTEIGKSMHVNEICTLLLNKYGRVTDRDSLSSALGKKARQGILLRQVSPATFDLIDREGSHA